MASRESQLMRPRSPSPTDAQTVLSLDEQRQSWEAEALKNPVPPGIQLETLQGPLAGESLKPEAPPLGTILYLHGGGFTQGSSKTHRHLAALMAKHTGWEVITLDYPLAPEHPFPQAIHFTVRAYQHLLEEGHDPSKLCMAGDSAGAQVALSALLSLRDAGLPLPACSFFISPWLDLTQSAETMISLASIDPMVTRTGLQQAAEAYLQGCSPSDPLASPLFADPGGLPAMLSLVGAHEVLLGDSLRLKAQTSRQGVAMQLQVFEDMWHVWPAWGESLPEAREALQAIREFLEDAGAGRI